MNKIIYKRLLPTTKLIYGAGLFIIGLISISQNYYSITFCVIGVYFFKTEGIEIDLKTKKYRETINLFNFSVGSWKDFPEIDYVSVFKTSQTTRIWVSTASTNVTNTEVKVNLFYDTNQKIEAYNTQDIEYAFEIAKQIATVLNVDILDATERESKWL